MLIDTIDPVKTAMIDLHPVVANRDALVDGTPGGGHLLRPRSGGW